MKSLVVINPNSSNKKTLKRYKNKIEPKLKARLTNFETAFSEYPTHTTSLVKTALSSGFDNIIAIGGDGTINEAVNGFFVDKKLFNENASLSVMNSGTGGDWMRTMRTDYTVDKVIDSILAEKSTYIDIGHLSFLDFNNKPKSAYFDNIASFGMGGLADKIVSKQHYVKMLGGTAAFFLAILQSMIKYSNKSVRVVIDGKTEYSTKIRNLAVANGKYFAGGMLVAPDAKMNDGLFEVVCVGDFNIRELLAFTPKIYGGKHIGHPKVKYHQASKVEAFSDEDVFLDIDGEPLGKLPATFTIMPKALKVII